MLISGTVKVWDPRQKDTPVVNMEPVEGETKRDCWTVAFGKIAFPSILKKKITFHQQMSAKHTKYHVGFISQCQYTFGNIGLKQANCGLREIQYLAFNIL